MLTVWGRKNSLNVQKAMWAIGELGLEHTRHDVGGPFGGLDTPEYLALNPNGRIPTVVDGDVIVWESNAVVRYLAAAHGAGSLWPTGAGVRAISDQWMDWVSMEVMGNLTLAFWHLVRFSEDERDMDVVKTAAAALASTFALLDRHLTGRTFIAGDQLTMGDVPAGAAVYRYLTLEMDRPALPAVRAYFDRLQERSAYRQHVMIPLS